MASFEEIRKMHPDWEGAFPEDLGPPNEQDLSALETEYGLSYPPSFRAFQLKECLSTPMGGTAWNGFGWANSELDAYMNLGFVVSGARQMGVPEYLAPFRDDEGNYYCFDTTRPDASGEFPVVFWDHDEGSVLNVPHYQWPNFVEWLADSFDAD